MNEIKEIIAHHKEKCFKCGSMTSKQDNGTFKCDSCGFEQANLFIKRIPVQTFVAFKEYADNEFVSDYGMALKTLIEKSGEHVLIEHILTLLQDLNARVSAIEEKKTYRTVDGKIHMR